MFERYTGQARRAIFFARFEATLQAADTISTAHLPLGIAREGCQSSAVVRLLKRRQKQIRTNLGIPHSNNRPPKAAFQWDMPLDDNAKLALAYAAQEADLDEHPWIDTDHLLRGLLRFPNHASGVLQSIGLDLAKVQTESKLLRAKLWPLRIQSAWILGALLRRHRAALAALAFLILSLLLARIFG